MDTERLNNEISQLVVKDNWLIQKERYNLTTIQQKFLMFIVSKIKPTDSSLKPIEINTADFCDILGLDINHFYGDFKKMIDDIDNRRCWIDTPEKTFKFYWFADVEMYKREAKVRITLSPKLEKYLLGLTKDFTQYELYNILALKSKYAIRLFELFKSYAYQQEKEFDVDELKAMLFADKASYSNFNNFDKKVLAPALNEINKYTELYVEYVKIRQGRKIVKIKFIILKKDALTRLQGFLETKEVLNRLNRKAEQIDGQMSIYDMEQKDDDSESADFNSIE